MDQPNTPKIVLPPRELFKNQKSRLRDKIGGSDYHYDLERAEVITGKGSRLYFKGMKFPIKGWPYKEATFVCNIVKRQTMMVALSLANKNINSGFLDVNILSCNLEILLPLFTLFANKQI